VRFLADESCDFAVVTALRAAGHDARNRLGEAVVSVVTEVGERITGSFFVIEPGRARVSRPRR
jgi:hypothetical protein